MRTYEEPSLTNETTQVYPIRFINTVMGDYTLPMASDYKFELKKVYVQEPSRNNSGAIAVFPDKFFVPYFTVTWNVMKFSNYSEIMRLIQVDELLTEYYDTNEEKYKRAKFYIQQPTYNKLYTMQMEYQFVTGLQLVFAGTMNDVETITISYDGNGGSGVVQTNTKTSGHSGDEVIIDSGASFTRTNYRFTGWNTKTDGTGDVYKPNARAVLTYSLELYAQWEAISG